LLGGFATISFLWLLCLRLNNHRWSHPGVPPKQWNALKPLALIGLFLVFCQIMLGGWVSSNYAALSCPDLPTCQNQWWPSMDFGRGFNVFQEIGPNYLGGQLDAESRVAIHMAHRIGAIIVTLYLLFLIFVLHSKSGSQQAKRLANRIGLVLAVQVSLGVSNIVFSLPLPVAVAHNAVGALLLLTLITLNFRLIRTTSGIY
jgi:cytochrome c oxidase assembly protein subunit 15